MRRGQYSRKAVEAVAIVVHLGGATDGSKGGIVPCVEVIDIISHAGAVGIDLCALGRLGGRQPGEATFVGDDWISRHLHNVDLGPSLCSKSRRQSVLGNLQVRSLSIDGNDHRQDRENRE